MSNTRPVKPGKESGWPTNAPVPVFWSTVISAPGFSGEPLPMPPYRSVFPVMPEAAGITESVRAHRRIFRVFIVSLLVLSFEPPAGSRQLLRRNQQTPGFTRYAGPCLGGGVLRFRR